MSTIDSVMALPMIRLQLLDLSQDAFYFSFHLYILPLSLTLPRVPKQSLGHRFTDDSACEQSQMSFKLSSSTKES